MLDTLPLHPCALTIAGSDSGGNAGIQADLRAFHALGVHGCTAIAALTSQNPFGVRSVQSTEPPILRDQLEAIFEAYAVSAAKTGMLAESALIETAAEVLSRYPVRLVADPVMIATSGARLLREDAVDALTRRLLPLATLITPNLPEAEVLLGAPVATLAEMAAAAQDLADRFSCAVLLKGGHAQGTRARDVFFDGSKVMTLSTPPVEDPVSTHGTGCTLSAAIAAALALGQTLTEAVITGKAFIYESIRTGIRIGPACGVLGTPASLPRENVMLD